MADQNDSVVDAKPVYQSKTMIVNAIIAGASACPPVATWISHNSELFGLAVSLLNIGLRSVTSDGITWKLFGKKF